MAAAPSGTVTFLFTDIQGSTRLWQDDPAAMDVALKRHDEVLRKSVTQHNGLVFKTVGDAFCCAFAEAADAVRAALAAQLAVQEEAWDTPRPIKVRMSIHTGTARERDNDYFGPPVNKVARIESLAHGGQVVMSRATAELVRDSLPEGVSLEDKGNHRLKDLNRPENIFQLIHPELPARFPPLKSMDALPNNLPVQTTPLIGRERELDGIRSLFKKDDCRLVSLVGPGGIGKTRLALQLAADMVDENRDGTWFVDLSTITQAQGVALETGRVLSIKQQTDSEPVEQVAEALSDKQLLVVLDNFEQVMSAYDVVVAWLRRSPGVRFIVTSREPLNIRGEHVYHVPPLSLPRVIGQGILSQFEATRLFIDRACASNPDFQVNNDNAPVVAEICARLDGIPLAIELAAARIRLLNPRAILKRLDTRLKILTGGPHDMPDRHKTLRACIDWSYDLLDETERSIYRAISVFHGGISLAGAYAVLEPVVDDELDVLDGLESLVDKSLISRKDPVAEEPFFAILETIGEYGRQRLVEADEEEDCVSRHSRYFHDVVVNAREAWNGPEQKAWIDRVSANSENIRHAMAHLAESGDGTSVVVMTRALVPFWIMRSEFRVCREWLSSALDQCGDPECGDAAWLTMQMGWLSLAAGNFEESRYFLLKSIDMFAAVDDATGQAFALDRLAYLSYVNGNMKLAEEYGNRALEKTREGVDDYLISVVRQNLANVYWRRGDVRKAIDTYLDVIGVLAAEGNVLRVAELKNNLGSVYFFLDELDQARRCYEEALPVLESFDDQNYLRYLLSNLGELALKQQNYTAALEYFEKVKNNAVRTMDRLYTGCAFVGLSEAYLGMGDDELAELCVLEAMDAVRQYGDSVEMGMAHRVVGQIKTKRRQIEEAEQEFRTAIAMLEPLDEAEELEKARECLEILK